MVAIVPPITVETPPIKVAILVMAVDYSFATTTDVSIDYRFYVSGSGLDVSVGSLNVMYDTNDSFLNVVVSAVTGNISILSDFFSYNNVYTTSTGAFHEIYAKAVHNGSAYQLLLQVDGVTRFATTTSALSTKTINELRVQRTGAGGNNNSTWRIDDIVLRTGDDVTPVSRVDVDAPDPIVYAFNPVPFNGTYNNLDTYDTIVFNLVDDEVGQNVYIPPLPIPLTNGEGLPWSFTRRLSYESTYTFSAALYDSVNDVYTSFSAPVQFALGSSTTPPVIDYGYASSTFGTSTLVAAGDFLSFLNVPALIRTKIPFTYLWQSYDLITEITQSNVTAASIPVGTITYKLPTQATSTFVAFSTSTITYFLTSDKISLLRTLMAAVLYVATLVSIYHIVRHSHII